MSQSESQSSSKFSFGNFSELFWKHFPIMMLWGEIGTGKTTLGLSLAKHILSDKKVFYLQTKERDESQLLYRIINPLEQENLISFHTQSFEEQTKIILKWMVQTRELRAYFRKNKVGLIIIDEIVNIYIREIMGDNSESLNRQLIMQLSTLRKIQKDLGIPVLLLNSFKMHEDEEQKFLPIPHGGKILEFWVDLEISMARTTLNSLRKFDLHHKPEDMQFPSTWNWPIGDHGF